MKLFNVIFLLSFSALAYISETGPNLGLYRLLPEVEKADATRKADPHFASFVERFLKLVEAYGLEKYVGLRLLHKHFSPTSGVMCEKFVGNKGTPALVTSEQLLQGDMLPASWMFDPSNPGVPGIPFEYTTDSGIREAREAISNSLDGQFFQTAQDMIIGSGYANLVAIGVLAKKDLVAQEGQAYMETSYKDASVVRIIPESELGTSIETSWGFTSGKGPRKVGCYSYCYRVTDNTHTSNGHYFQ